MEQTEIYSLRMLLSTSTIKDVKHSKIQRSYDNVISLERKRHLLRKISTSDNLWGSFTSHLVRLVRKISTWSVSHDPTYIILYITISY